MSAARSSSTSSSQRSDVWKFMTKDSSEKTVTCKLSEKNLAYHGATSNLRD